MNKLEQAARQALEALEIYEIKLNSRLCNEAITALREALAEQAEQEPVAEALQIASVALQDISCSSQTDNLLWWQTRAREAQKQIAECLTNAAPVQQAEQEPVAWIEGYPKDFYAEEWFIAITIYGDRVVLKALPENYSYDFTTADGTYMKKENVKRWMQFPDSEFLPPTVAAPVRTKDLTEDEIMKINVDTAGIVPTCDRQFHFARAVIAADREKNRG